MAFPHERGRAHRPPTGHVTAFDCSSNLECGFPYTPYFRSILHYYNLMVFQVKPNGWAHMIGLFILFIEWKIDHPLWRSFLGFTPSSLGKATLGFISFRNGHLRKSRLLPRSKKVLVTRRMLTSSRFRPVSEVASLSQVSFS